MLIKNKLIIGIVLTGAIILTGCGGGNPVPSKPHAKPTVYIKSNTAEKFKNVTEETAIWNGIPPQFIKDKQYMRCDMSEEAMAVFARRGFEVVTSPFKADYTFEVTLLSCGQRSAHKNRSEVPLTEKALYKDLKKWVNETEPSKLPNDAKEIVSLISQYKPEGFKRFYEEGYIKKYGDEFGSFGQLWRIHSKETDKYLKKTKGVLLPNKYYDMPEEDREILSALHKKFQDSKLIEVDFTKGSMQTLGASARAGGRIGNIGAGVGLLFALLSTTPPTPINLFTVTNNRTNKTWSKEMSFDIAPQSWKKNIDKPLDDWVIDEIPWNKLN